MLLAVLMSGTAQAGDEAPIIPRLLESDDPNFFGMSGATGDPALGERPHFEFNVSIKYPLVESRFQRKKQNDAWRWLPDRLYGVYNGSYDFYAVPHDGDASFTAWYDSAPVISKHQNPGLALEWNSSNEKSKIRLGVFHHSNGQTLDEDDIETIQSYIDQPDTYKPYYWLEEVSRSSNYFQLRYQRINNAAEEVGPGWYQYQIEVRPHYFATDDKLFWLPTLIEQPKIQDFEGIRLLYERFLPSSYFGSVAWISRFQLKTGISDQDALGNVSAKLTLGFMWRTFIVSTYYEDGYGHDLSTYHLRTKHWGIGLEFR